MKLAIMQPYFFPYIGYWQLIHAVDRFVIYDDVTYIKGGWINRNRILINNNPSYITIPLQQSSSYKKICDILTHPSPVWRRKMIKSIKNTYRKAPFFTDIFPVTEKIINYGTDNLANFLAHSISTMANFMGLKTEFVTTSRCYQNNNLTGQCRVLDICKYEDATTYINPQGGQTLYNTETFQRANIDLRFIVMQPMPYNQRSSGFVPYLSIIDVLMELGPVKTLNQISKFRLYAPPPVVQEQAGRHVSK